MQTLRIVITLSHRQSFTWCSPGNFSQGDQYLKNKLLNGTCPQTIFEDWCTRRRQRERQKKQCDYIGKTTTLYVHQALLYILFSVNSFNPWVNPPKNCHQLTWNTRDKVWGRLNSLFQWGFFRSHRRRCCLSFLLSTSGGGGGGDRGHNIPPPCPPPPTTRLRSPGGRSCSIYF